MDQYADTLVRIVADATVVVAVLVGGVTYFLSVRRERYQNYARALMAGLSAYLVAKIMSLFYQSLERPFVTLGVEPKASFLDNPGFPSDHALFVMAIALVVWAATSRRDVAVVLFVIALVVGAGRIAALVHTPQDVIGGYVAAFIGVGMWYGFFLRKKTI